MNAPACRSARPREVIDVSFKERDARDLLDMDWAGHRETAGMAHA